MPYWPRGYMGMDKIGRPIYIERSGKIQPIKVEEIINLDEMWPFWY